MIEHDERSIPMEALIAALPLMVKLSEEGFAYFTGLIDRWRNFKAEPTAEELAVLRQHLTDADVAMDAATARWKALLPKQP